MLRILGSANLFGRDCNRREVMRIGALGAAALSLPELLFMGSAAAFREHSPTNSPFGKAKRIMLLYLQGAASQFETWDPKPDAPEEIRGKWGAISTSVPGVAICDQLPRLSAVADRMAIVRSMTHEHNNHSNLYTLSGFPAIDFTSETNPLDILATMYHLSGIDSKTTIPDRLGRPVRLVDGGNVIDELLA